MRKFQLYPQENSMDCGPTCLFMIAKWYDKPCRLPLLRKKCNLQKNGVSLKGLINGAEFIGLKSLAIEIAYEENTSYVIDLLSVIFPCIVHWKQNHFIIVCKANKEYVWIADPAFGKYRLNRNDFEKGWSSKHNKGIVILIEQKNTASMERTIAIDTSDFIVMPKNISYRKTP